jgi:hypothetical protein
MHALPQRLALITSAALAATALTLAAPSALAAASAVGGMLAATPGGTVSEILATVRR